MSCRTNVLKSNGTGVHKDRKSVGLQNAQTGTKIKTDHATETHSSFNCGLIIRAEDPSLSVCEVSHCD